MGSSLNQRAAEFSLCNTLVLLLDLSFKQSSRSARQTVRRKRDAALDARCAMHIGGESWDPNAGYHFDGMTAPLPSALPTSLDRATLIRKAP